MIPTLARRIALTALLSLAAAAAAQSTYPAKPIRMIVAVPPGGLGAQLDAMHHFHRAKGIHACLGLGRRDEGRDYLRWYFTRPTAAESFAAEFGGTVIKSSR